MKQAISITVEKEDLLKFDEMMEERMISRSRFFDKAMKTELKKWNGE